MFASLRRPYAFVDGGDARGETRARVLEELTTGSWPGVAYRLPDFRVTLELRSVSDPQETPPTQETLAFRFVEPPRSIDGIQVEDSEILLEASYQLEFAAKQLIRCANIAAPGILSVTRFYGTAGEIARREMLLSDQLFAAAELARNREWPPIRDDLAVRDVWAWACRLPGFSLGVGETPAGRAVAALSHIFGQETPEYPGNTLYWALLGLEALFGEGSSGLSQQLREKAYAFLGEPISHRKAISRLYNFRSRLFHGDLDVPYASATFDSLHGFTDKLDDEERFAVALLVSAIQKMIDSDRLDLRFEYVLETA